MSRWKLLLKKLFHLPPLATLLIALPSFALVTYVLIIDSAEKGSLDYIAYLLSAYALVLVVTGTPDFIRAFCRLPLLRGIRSHPLKERFFRDDTFRTRLTLYEGVLVNLAYAVVKLVCGILFRSSWLMAISVYYFLLVATRFVLLHHVNQKALGTDLRQEYQKCRICGIILLIINQALAVVVIFMVRQGKYYEYPGILIYVMAAYAFYAIILAIVNTVRFRRHPSPVFSASKVINLTAAMVSVLALETGMLAQFGSDNDMLFRTMMTSITGGVGCTVVFILVLFMIIRSTRKLKVLKKISQI